MPRLSIIMIVKNEAHCLARCLESVRGIADEIVVADTGSTDDTVAIAERFGATVLRIPWEDDFAKARNAAIQSATGDWLLHLDADEMLDAEGARRIRWLVDQDGSGADAVELTLANYCDEPRAWRWAPVRLGDPYARGRSGYIAVGLLRLFRNHRGFEYREPVHENITESVLEKGGKVRREDILIHHYGYDPAKHRTGEKAALYLAIARKKMGERPGDTKAIHDFAEQALACNHTDDAETACRRALDIDPLELNAASTLANILLNRGDYAEARVLLEGLVAGGIAPPHVLSALGAIACREGRLDEAQDHLEAVLEAAPHTVMARLYLARVYDQLGRPEDALRQLEVARDTAPTIEEFQQRVQAHALRTEAGHLFAAGVDEEALRRLLASLRLDPDDPLTHNDLGVLLHALGESEKARESFRRALLLAPSLLPAHENLQVLFPRSSPSSAS